MQRPEQHPSRTSSSSERTNMARHSSLTPPTLTTSLISSRTPLPSSQIQGQVAQTLIPAVKKMRRSPGNIGNTISQSRNLVTSTLRHLPSKVEVVLASTALLALPRQRHQRTIFALQYPQSAHQPVQRHSSTMVNCQRICDQLSTSSTATRVTPSTLSVKYVFKVA